MTNPSRFCLMAFASTDAASNSFFALVAAVTDESRFCFALFADCFARFISSFATLAFFTDSSNAVLEEFAVSIILDAASTDLSKFPFAVDAVFTDSSNAVFAVDAVFTDSSNAILEEFAVLIVDSKDFFSSFPSSIDCLYSETASTTVSFALTTSSFSF